MITSIVITLVSTTIYVKRTTEVLDYLSGLQDPFRGGAEIHPPIPQSGDRRQIGRAGGAVRPSRFASAGGRARAVQAEGVEAAVPAVEALAAEPEKGGREPSFLASGSRFFVRFVFS